MVELSVSQLWCVGPEWLHLGSPIHSDIESSPMPDLCSQELKTTSKLSHNLLTVDSKPTIRDLIHSKDFSDLQRLLRVTAYVLRAVDRFKVKKNSHSIPPSELTPQEITAAELLWISHAQKELVFQGNFNILKHQLGLFLNDKGLWRCGGRLQNAEIPYSAKYPVLLPRSQQLTALVVRDAHLCVYHNGVKETLTEVRRRYWVIKGRSLTRAIVHRCTICKRYYVCDPDDEDFEVNASQLTRRMKHLSNVLNHFWSRWRSEYLNELRESHRYVAKKNSRSPHVTKGDVVIVQYDALPRGFWKLGRIQEIFIGSDGLPLSALVGVATKDRQHTLLKRLLQLLYPLEISGPELGTPSKKVPASSQDDQTDNTPVPRRHPVRAAAKKASEKRRVWIQELQGRD